MLVVRAVEERDIDGLLALAQQAGSGMTTLKPDRAALTQRVEVACASFAETIAPRQRDYVFVLEDLEAGRIAGVCAIQAAVGLDEPFYSYRIGTLVHSSNELKVYTPMETLYLSNDLTGSAELCSLFLHPQYRSGTNGKLLSKSRLMFIAQFPQLFPQRLIAELRGFLRPDGRSPFWDHLGRHFFHMEFERADGLSRPGQKAFIAELMPRHPLYVAYLHKEAREVIGMVHTDTAPARRMLEQEGLHCEGYVDIFDAGPVLQVRVSQLRALRESALALAEQADEIVPPSAPLLVSNTSLAGFRALVSEAPLVSGRLGLTTAQLAALDARAGAPLRTLPLNPTRS